MPFLPQAMQLAVPVLVPNEMHTESAHGQCGTFTLPVLAVELCLRSQLCVNGPRALEDVF